MDADERIAMLESQVAHLLAVADEAEQARSDTALALATVSAALSGFARPCTTDTGG